MNSTISLLCTLCGWENTIEWPGNVTMNSMFCVTKFSLGASKSWTPAGMMKSFFRRPEGSQLLSINTLFTKSGFQLSLEQNSWQALGYGLCQRFDRTRVILYVSFSIFILQFQGYSSSYNGNFDPRITNEFSTAAFRFGHSLIPSSFARVRQESLGSSLSVKEIFFQPEQACHFKSLRSSQRFKFIISDKRRRHNVRWLNKRHGSSGGWGLG